MASIFKRGDSGSWTIEFTDSAGVRRRVGGGKSRKLAGEKAAMLERQAVVEDVAGITPGQTRLRDQDALKLDDHVAAYLRSLETSGRSPRTVRSARAFLAIDEKRGGGIAKHLGVAKLSEIAPSVIERYLHGVKSKGRSARTANWRLALLSSFLSWCARDGRISSNPCRSVGRQNVDRDRRYRRRALTAKEREALFAEAEKRGARAVYYGAYYGGLRRSELERLTWSSVDLDGAKLTIADGKARRVDVLPIAPPLLDELKRIRPELALPSARVFPCVPNNVARRETFEAAGLKSPDADGFVLDLHSLRTSLATDLARGGASVQVAKALMRHSTVDLTLKAYTKLRVDDLAGGLAALAAPSNAAPAKLAQQDAQQATGTDGDVPEKVAVELAVRTRQHTNAHGGTKWARQDLNLEPTDYESAALTR